jgi:hypothetical protein
MIGPPTLAAIFGIIMLVAAATTLGRIAYTVRSHRATDFRIDFHNVLMGIAMAGMLIPSLGIVTTGWSTTIWLIVWILVTAGFAVSVIRDAVGARQQWRLHHGPHLVMSAAMAYMLWATGSDAAQAISSRVMETSGMSMPALGIGTVPLPTLDYAFAIFMVCYAVVIMDRLPVAVLVDSGSLRIVGLGRPGGSAAVVAPRLAAATNIVMAITMGYMLTMMFV